MSKLTPSTAFTEAPTPAKKCLTTLSTRRSGLTAGAGGGCGARAALVIRRRLHRGRGFAHQLTHRRRRRLEHAALRGDLRRVTGGMHTADRARAGVGEVASPVGL